MTRKQKNTQMCKCAKEGGVNEIKDKKSMYYVLGTSLSWLYSELK